MIYMTLAEIAYLKDIARGKRILEIGTFDGGSAALMLGAGALKVTTIDLFNPDALQNEDSRAEYQRKFQQYEISEEKTRANLIEYANCNLIVGESKEIVPCLKDGEYDMVLIDGDHSYEGVKADCANTLLKLKKNGLILFHDNNQKFPGVMKALQEVTLPKIAQVDSLTVFQKRLSVTAEISTKDRYFSTLPMTISGIITQNITPDKLLIFDDSENVIDLRTVPIYQHLFRLLDMKGIRWEVVFGEKKGQTLNHQKALRMADTDCIWRLDDDLILESNVLETLLDQMNDGVGAVGCCIWHPDRPVIDLPPHINGKINLLSIEYGAMEWFRFQGIRKVEHLYSSFLYRRQAALEAGGYPMDLSFVGHHEETIFSHKIMRAGYELIVTPDAKMYHLRNPEGGIRSYQDQSLWQQDHEKFIRLLEEWGYKPQEDKIIVLDNGLGDHWVFKQVLQKIKAISNGTKIIIACCYPEVFADDDVTIISIADAYNAFGNLDRYNLYKWCAEHDCHESIEKAFEAMYLQ